MSLFKNKFMFYVIILGFLFLVKYIFFNYPISAGKRIGNLTKLSLRGNIIKTWEGTLNEGYGEKLTTFFSISKDKLAKELYAHEGREVVIFYEEYLVGWPRDTTYDVIKWEAQLPVEQATNSKDDAATKLLSKTLFCTFLGSLKTNEDLYQKVKNHMENNNYYLFKQYEECNR